MSYVVKDPALVQRYRDLGLWTDEKIGWLLESAAGRWPDREFLCIDGQRLTYVELNRKVLSAAAWLHGLGVTTGDRIVMQSGNCLPLLIVQFAAWRIGAVSVPIVPIYRVHEMRAIIEETKPVVVAAARVAGSRFPYQEIDQVLSSSSVKPKVKLLFGEGDAVVGWEALPPVSDVVSADLPDPGPTEECCTILFTSGTTSAPKGVLMSSRALMSGIQNWRMNLDLYSDYVACSGAPLTHIGALYTALLVPLACGARTVLMPNWNPDVAIKVIEEEKANYMAGATVFLHDLVERYERGESPSHRLSYFCSGGSPTPPSLVHRAEAMGIKASRSYGMTETCGTISQASRYLPLERRATTEGRLTYGSEVQIVGDDHNVLANGAVGHIRIRSPQLMNGYTDDAINRAQFRDGWFYPDDLGSLSDDGYLTMAGRTKDIINRGGEKFSSQDIEAALVAHAPILGAAVIGVPHPRLGEAVCACLTLRENAAWNGPEEILAHLEAFGLARPKFPVEWLVVDEFPRTASGKVQKNVLFVMVAERRSAAEADETEKKFRYFSCL